MYPAEPGELELPFPYLVGLWGGARGGDQSLQHEVMWRGGRSLGYVALAGLYIQVRSVVVMYFVWEAREKKKSR